MILTERESIEQPIRLRVAWAAVLIAGLASVVACAPPLGGWDIERLVAEEPSIARLEAQRLGDLIPYPVPISEGFELVSCRWASGGPIRVHLHLEGERLVWAQRAVESLSAGTPSIELEAVAVAPDVEDDLPGSQVIEVIEVDPDDADHPIGVGDTLVACDVSSRDATGFGTPTIAEIRMRSTMMDQIDEIVAVAAEDWTGALMHELGHALGFQGHLRGGTSILVRDQSVLRRAGSDALAGEPWRDETLEALYRLEPGRVLGRRVLSKESQRWVRAAERRAGDEQSLSGGPRAKVGDRHGQLEWTNAEGETLRLHLPFWPRQLRAGEAIVAFPGTKTRQTLTAQRSSRRR